MELDQYFSLLHDKAKNCERFLKGNNVSLGYVDKHFF